MTADASYRRIDIEPVDVALVLDDYTIHGTVHAEQGKQRFSDAWEALLRESRAFLPVTDVNVSGHATEAPDLDRDFLLVEKAEVRAAYPIDSLAIGQGTPRRIDVAPVETALILEAMRIEGTIFGPPRKSRFSDFWEAILGQPRSFIPVTKVKMSTHDGSRVLAQTDFMVVEKAEVITAHPIGAEPEGESNYSRDDLVAVQVCVVLERMRARGTVHIESPKGDRFSRFSDLWESVLRDRRRYIPITNAHITTVDGSRALGDADFMVFDKDEVRAAFPAEDD